MHNDNYDRIKDYIHSHPDIYLHPDNSGKGYVCPICGNGSHKANSRGLESKDKVHFSCFSQNCFTNADIIDIIAIQKGIASADFKEKIEAAAEMYGIDMDTPISTPIKEKNSGIPTVQQKPDKEQKIDYTAFYAETREALTQRPDQAVRYLASRGISIDTAISAGVGYAENWHHSHADSRFVTPRLIFPLDECSYTTRDVRPIEQIPEKNRAFIKQREGTSTYGTFRVDALDGSMPVFVTEGELDALSVLEAGQSALSIGSATNASKFIDLIKAKSTAGASIPHLFICMDNDAAGQSAATRIHASLEQLQIPHTVCNIAGDCKDANEALQQDKSFLLEGVQSLLQGIETKVTEQTELKYQGIQTQADYFEDAENGFFAAINKRKTQGISTGFHAIDDAWKLYPGIFLLGGMPGIGKSSLALQIAVNIANAGERVLYYSLEQSVACLSAKAITCYLKKHTKQKPDTWSKYYNGTVALPKLSIKEYVSNVGRNLAVTYASTPYTATLKHVVNELVKNGQKPPIIIIDYCQLLKSNKPAFSERNAVETALDDLIEIQREHGLTMLAICSLSRAGYSDPSKRPTMAALKESGKLEYSADQIYILWGQNKLTLSNLKNKEGHGNWDISMVYDGDHSCFKTEGAIKEPDKK